MTLTGDDVKRIRELIGEFRGRRMTQYDLGLALGLSPKNADRAVRDWEELGPSGPTNVALHLIETVIMRKDLEAALAALFQLQLPLED
jgi:DNA-binding transcriptional regulator YiaG